MKKIKNILLLLPLLGLFASCEEGDVFTGTPLDDPNQQIVTLDAVVSTTTTVALTDQKIPFTVQLPMTFTDTVRVEATTLSDGGRRRRAYLEILPNTSTATGDILAAGGDIYSSKFTLALTAIEFYNGVPGIHYLLKSNVIQINTGSTVVPDNDLSRLQIKLAWPNASSTTNRLRLSIDRPDALTDAVPNLTGSFIAHTIRIENAVSSGSNTSANTTTIPGGGDFILSINAILLVTSPFDMPYRLVINYPNDTVEVFEGVYNGLEVGSPLKPIAKISKIVAEDGSVSFTTTPL